MLSLNLAQVKAELVLSGVEKTKAGLDQIKSRLFSVKSAVVSLVATYGISRIASSFLDVAKSVESYQVRLNAVIGDTQEAQKTFEDINKWAAINPIDTQDAIAAFVRLKSAAVANTKEALEATADLATVMGANVADVAGAIVSTETEVLRRLGIIIDRTGKQAIIQSGNVRIAVKKDIESVRKGIIEVIQKNFAGSMKSAGDTWKGIMDTISGMWTVFKQDIMGSAGTGGPFDVLKGAIMRVRDAWSAWMTSDDYKKFVQDMQDNILGMFDIVLAGLQSVVKGVEILVTFASNMPSTFKYGVLGRILLGPRGALIGALSGLLMDVVKAIPKADIAGVLGISQGDLEKLRKGEFFQEQKIAVTVEKSSSFTRIQDAIGSLRETLKNPVEIKASSQGKVNKGPENEVDKAEEAKKKYSELAEMLAKALGISKEAAELRIKNAQREGEYTAAAIERLEKRNEKEREYIAIAQEGTSQFYAQLAEQFNAGMISTKEYFDIVQRGFMQLKTEADNLGLDSNEFLSWPADMKQRFLDLQNATTSLLEPAIELLNEQLQDGTLTSSEYSRKIDSLISSMSGIIAISPTLIDGVLVRLREEWEEGRLSTQKYVAALENLKTSLQGMTGIQEKITMAQETTGQTSKDLFSQIREGANLTVEALSETFSAGIVQGRSFLDTLKQIGREMVQFALKKYVLQPLFGMMFPFAEGGIVTGPTPALVGEAGPEAIIPLSHGSVPVRFEGMNRASENNITVICAIDRENIESIATETLGKRGDIVVAHVNRDFAEGGVTKKTFRR